MRNRRPLSDTSEKLILTIMNDQMAARKIVEQSLWQAQDLDSCSNTIEQIRDVLFKADIEVESAITLKNRFSIWEKAFHEIMLLIGDSKTERGVKQ